MFKTYSPEEKQALIHHIEEHYGPIWDFFAIPFFANTKIFKQSQDSEAVSSSTEQDSDDGQALLEVAVIPPNPKGEYFRLITIGLGANEMSIATALNEESLDQSDQALDSLKYAELSICLPANWNFEKDAMEHIENCWPFNALSVYSSIPFSANTFLSTGGPLLVLNDFFAPNTKLAGAVLGFIQGGVTSSSTISNAKADKTANITVDTTVNNTEQEEVDPNTPPPPPPVLTLASGRVINLYQVIPLYNEEIDLKKQIDINTFHHILAKYVSFVVDPQRENFALTKQKEIEEIVKLHQESLAHKHAQQSLQKSSDVSQKTSFLAKIKAFFKL